MNPEYDEDLGVEYYDDIVARENQPQQPQQPQEEKGFIQKAADAGAFGILGSAEGRRHAGRTAARVAETLVGLPGDVKELFNSIMIGVPEYFAGEELPRWRQMVEGPPKGTFIGGFGMGEPTSRELREDVTQTLTGDYLEPQSKWEEFGDSIAQDFAALAIPVKGKVPFARALGTSILANSGGEVARAFGGDTAAEATKMGLLFTSGLLGQKGGGVKQYIRNLYKDMEGSIPEGASVSAKNLEAKLASIEKKLRMGDPNDLSKAPALQKIKAIRDKVQGGQIDVDEVIELTKSTNESIFGLGELKRGQNELYNIRSALHDTAKEYGRTNADFLSKWKNANEAYAATETSRKIGNWVKRNIKAKDYIYAASALGIEGAALGAPATATTLGAAGGLAATAYTAEVMKRIAQSPALRKYYTNVVTNSLKQNKGGFLRAMKQLDDGLKQSFDDNPYETVEFED